MLLPEKEVFLFKDSRTELDLLSGILELRHIKLVPLFFPAPPPSVMEQHGMASSQGGCHCPPTLLVCLSSPHQALALGMGLRVKQQNPTIQCRKKWARSQLLEKPQWDISRTRIRKRKTPDEHWCWCLRTARHMWRYEGFSFRRTQQKR